MTEREAIIAAFAQLPPSTDGYHNIGEVAWLAAKLLSGSVRRNLARLQREFTAHWRELPFEFSTHLARTPSLYRCGRHRWPRGGYLCDGVLIGGQNCKLLRRKEEPRE